MKYNIHYINLYKHNPHKYLVYPLKETISWFYRNPDWYRYNLYLTQNYNLHTANYIVKNILKKSPKYLRYKMCHIQIIPCIY